MSHQFVYQYVDNDGKLRIGGKVSFPPYVESLALKVITPPGAIDVANGWVTEDKYTFYDGSILYTIPQRILNAYVFSRFKVPLKKRIIYAAPTCGKTTWAQIHPNDPVLDTDYVFEDIFNEMHLSWNVWWSGSIPKDTRVKIKAEVIKRTKRYFSQSSGLTLLTSLTEFVPVSDARFVRCNYNMSRILCLRDLKSGKITSREDFINPSWIEDFAISKIDVMNNIVLGFNEFISYYL